MRLAKSAALSWALAALLLAAPGVAPAANFCVWNFDPVDRFYDPEAGDSVDCSYRLARALTGQGHSVTVSDTFLPQDLSSYDAVFCLMGWYRC